MPRHSIEIEFDCASKQWLEDLLICLARAKLPNGVGMLVATRFCIDGRQVVFPSSTFGSLYDAFLKSASTMTEATALRLSLKEAQGNER